jgi:DNA-binding HxlR family transcriptional regulator
MESNIRTKTTSDSYCNEFDIVYSLPQLKKCPIEVTFKIIGKRWTALILREMFKGNKQFNRILENIGGITSKVFTERMKELQELGIVKRVLVSESPVRIIYELTPLGEELRPILLVAAAFSMKHLPKEVFKDGKPYAINLSAKPYVR